jgi:hypothetical protein
VGVATTDPDADPWALLDRLNGWCESYPGECNLYENPHEFPDQASTGESNGFLSDAKERLDALGFDYGFDVGRHRYLSRSEADINLMIGGSFAVDHVGPEAHAAVLQRVHARPQEYLDVFERRLLERLSTPDALADLLPEVFLFELEPDAPDEVRVLASVLLDACERAIADSSPAADADTEEGRRLYRLRGRAAGLRRLATGVP